MPKRKAARADTPEPATKKPKLRDGPVSNLTPVHPRERAVVGQKNPALLRMLLDDSKTGKRKELHFKKLIHSEIDWNSAEDIAKINSWRNQLYGRAGMKAKSVTMWHKDEECWLELYYHLLIVEAYQHGLMVPRARDVLDDFNMFFEGAILVDDDGEEIEPRVARKHNAFVSKLNRVVTHLKERLEMVLLGKTGDYFRPGITSNMLAKYKGLKHELEGHGIYEEIFGWGDALGGTTDWKNLEFWVKFISNLPDAPASTDSINDDTQEDAKVDDVDMENGNANAEVSQPPVKTKVDDDFPDTTSDISTLTEVDDKLMDKLEGSFLSPSQQSHARSSASSSVSGMDTTMSTDITEVEKLDGRQNKTDAKDEDHTATRVSKVNEVAAAKDGTPDGEDNHTHEAEHHDEMPKIKDGNCEFPLISPLFTGSDPV